MRMLIVSLLWGVIGFIEKGNKSACICDVLDRMYIRGEITFYQMRFLHGYIEKHVPESLIQSAVETQNAELFTEFLKKHIEFLQEK